MSESIKAACAVVLVVSAFTAVMVWTEDRPDALTWSLRIGCIVLPILALSLFLALHFRYDVAPDFLRQLRGDYFNRDGFCFAFGTGISNGMAFIDAYYQNQYAGPCLGQIALRTAKGFFLNRAKIETIVFGIECEPAAFGAVRMPIPVPHALQGKHQSFEVGASVFYPEGKGQRLRFFHGIPLDTNTDFRGPFSKGVVIFAAVTGHFILSKPATVKIALPANVPDELPSDAAPMFNTLWRLGYDEQLVLDP
jgi:hypothetical protein